LQTRKREGFGGGRKGFFSVLNVGILRWCIKKSGTVIPDGKRVKYEGERITEVKVREGICFIGKRKRSESIQRRKILIVQKRVVNRSSRRNAKVRAITKLKHSAHAKKRPLREERKEKKKLYS